MRGDRLQSDGGFIDEPVMFRPSLVPVFDLPDWNFLYVLAEMVAFGECSERQAAVVIAAERRRLRRLNVVELRPRAARKRSGKAG